MNDWSQAQYVHEIASRSKIRASHPIGVVDNLAVAYSERFVYVRVDFERSRLAPPSAPADAFPEDEGNYLRLDLDRDNAWDQEVQTLITGVGAIACRVVSKDGTLTLAPLGDPAAIAEGPIAALSADGRSIEFRLPRAALGLTGEAMLRLQAQVRYRPPGDIWRQIIYPSASAWLVCKLK